MGVPIAQWDGAAEFWVDKPEDLLALFGDAEYQEVRTILRTENARIC